MVSWIVILYGVLVAAGGLMGYVRANSMASLLAGAVSGLALVGAGALMARGSYQTGWWIALVVAILLLGRFGSAAASGGFKMMPGGMVILTSLIVIGVLLTSRVR
jgi:uncharacterized membrane protein (UPF0136 family)